MDETPQTVPLPPIEDRVKMFENSRVRSLVDLHLRETVVVSFPNYSLLPELPEEVRLALAVIKRHGGVFKYSYGELGE